MDYEEIWVDIIGYYGLYQISNKGKIRSKSKLKNLRVSTNGYLIVDLYKNNIQKTFTVHRLVAINFIHNEKNLPEVNHIDENKLNNTVNNLEWCTREYNQLYGHRISKMRESKSIPLLQISTSGEMIKEWESSRQCERELGYNHSNINKCCNGKYKTAYSFIWKYKEKKT